jgi:hypothetical protein
MNGLFAQAKKKVEHKMLNKIVVTNMKNNLQPYVNDEMKDFLQQKIKRGSSN